MFGQKEKKCMPYNCLIYYNLSFIIPLPECVDFDGGMKIMHTPDTFTCVFPLAKLGEKFAVQRPFEYVSFQYPPNVLPPSSVPIFSIPSVVEADFIGQPSPVDSSSLSNRTTTSTSTKPTVESPPHPD